MMPKLPSTSSLPPILNPIIHLPPTTTQSQISNIVIFLPGLGDSSPNFSNFAKALNLPDSVALTLQPPFPLPAPIGPGFSWCRPEKLNVDSSTGEIDTDDSSIDELGVKLVGEVIRDVLLAETESTKRAEAGSGTGAGAGCGFTAKQVHLFGYGQGGSVALCVGLWLAASTSTEATGKASMSSTSSAPTVTISGSGGLGSIISIGGPLPLTLPFPISQPTATSAIRKDTTSVLVLSGTRGALGMGSSSALKRIKDSYANVEHHVWKRSDDGLPRSREEVLPMMKFWGRRLGSRRGVPDGAVEVG